ncbi:hypothetical protein [Neobacillus drentensis]|uniref:hypothetical protein n=1 Tax=Neobacillus drentensis TaxID=220684 RepID=UPI003000FDB8
MEFGGIKQEFGGKSYGVGEIRPQFRGINPKVCGIQGRIGGINKKSAKPGVDLHFNNFYPIRKNVS